MLKRVHEAVRRGPANAGALALRMGMEVNRAQSLISLLMQSRVIVSIGTVGDALACNREDVTVAPGRLNARHIRVDGKIYAEPGTTPLPKAKLNIAARSRMRLPDARRDKLPGNIAPPCTIGRGLRWGASWLI